MCQFSPLPQLTGQSASHSKHEKHPFYNMPQTPTPLFFFLFFFYSSKACDGHPGRLGDTDGWVRASFLSVKYQAPVRPVNSSSHNYTNTHMHEFKEAGKPLHFCNSHVPRCVFFHSWNFPFECGDSWGKKAFIFTCMTLEAMVGRSSSLRDGYLTLWLVGGKSRCRGVKAPRLGTNNFVFIIYMTWVKEVCGRKVSSVLISLILVYLIWSCLFHSYMGCNYADLSKICVCKYIYKHTDI